jgi:hypothetical protein
LKHGDDPLQEEMVKSIKQINEYDKVSQTWSDKIRHQRNGNKNY